MKQHERWNGGKAERTLIVDYIFKSLRAELFPEMDKKQFGKVFAEALLRNMVQAELREMMICIVEEEK